MHSKYLLLPVLALVLSCAPKVGEAPPEPKSQKLESLDCIPEIKPALQAFTAGTATDAGLETAWSCSQEAVRMFKTYVEGREDDHFTPREIATFMEKKFLHGANIPDNLVTQVMHVKRLFVGGSVDSVTRPELDAFVQTLGKFKNFSLQLNPYMKVFVQKWSPQQSFVKSTEQIEYFEKANSTLQVVADELAETIIAQKQDYELDQFPVFVSELENFLQIKDGAYSETVNTYFPTVKKAKVAVSAGDEKVLHGSEWTNFIAAAAKGYAQYLRYYYFAAPLSESEQNVIDAEKADYLFRSVDDVLKTAHVILGRKPSALSRRELGEVFTELAKANSNFKFSDELLLEIMKVKVLYFGGAAEDFTVLDLETGLKKFAVLQKNIELLMPHYAVLTGQWKPDPKRFSEEQLRLLASKSDLYVAANEVAGLISGSYDLQNLKALLNEYDRLYEGTLSTKLQHYYAFIKDVKSTVFSDGDSVILSEHWKPFLQLAARGYGAYLQYNYFVKDQTYGSWNFLDGLKVFAEELTQFLQTTLANNAQKTIARTQVQSLVRDLADLKMLPEGISRASLEKLVDLAITRVLWPAERRLDGAQAPGITSASILNAYEEFEIWYETERFFYTLAPKNLTHEKLRAEVLQKLSSKLVTKLDPKFFLKTDARSSAPLTPFLKAGLEGSSMVLAGNVSKVVDEKLRLLISRKTEKAYDVRSLSQLNLHRMMGRALIRTAINDKTRLQKNKGISLNEAEAVFSSVRPALLDLAIIDSANTSFIKSRFSESNVFSPHSNGDTLSNFEEVTDIVGMIFSGIKINLLFRQNLIDSCQLKLKLGEDQVVAESCVYDAYYANSAKNLESMPEHVRVLGKVSRETWNTFFGFVLSAAGHVPNEAGTIQMSRLCLAPHVIQYMEMLYSSYDQDQNDIIDTNEAIRAYPAFSGLMAELTKEESLIKPDQLPALFTYILKYGEAPKGAVDYFTRWLVWKNLPTKWWSVSADRTKVAQIFSFIADKTRHSRKKLIEAPEEREIRNDPRFLVRMGEDPQYYGM